MMDKIAKQVKAQKLLESYGVNMADRWRERVRSYLGRSHGSETQNPVVIQDWIVRSQQKP